MKKNIPLFLLLAILLFCGTAHAASCHVPPTVLQGHAFPVTVSDSHPFEAIFLWRGEKIAVPSIHAGNDLWEASVLLALPLDAKGRHPLTIFLDAEKHDFTIAAKKVDWPQSILKVAPRYVEPPRRVLDQIAIDQKHVRMALAARSERQWALPLERPVPGGITSRFGSRRVFNGKPRAPHKGTDLRSPEGSPVRAAADGVVLIAEPQYYGGNIIYLDHGQGVISIYGHLSTFDVTPGERVQKGQVIGCSGSTGRVTGPHLHFGLMVQGVAVDAMPLLSMSSSSSNETLRDLPDSNLQKAMQ